MDEMLKKALYSTCIESAYGIVSGKFSETSEKIKIHVFLVRNRNVQNYKVIFNPGKHRNI